MKMNNLYEMFTQYQFLVDLQNGIPISIFEKNRCFELPLEAVFLWGMKDFFIQNEQGESEWRVLSCKEALASYQQNQKCIRLIDCLSNNFLVYDISSKKYSLFNAIENDYFNNYETLLHFFEAELSSETEQPGQN